MIEIHRVRTLPTGDLEFTVGPPGTPTRRVSLTPAEAATYRRAAEKLGDPANGRFWLSEIAPDPFDPTVEQPEDVDERWRALLVDRFGIELAEEVSS